MSQILEELEKIEVAYRELIQKLDADQIQYEQFETKVDKLPSLEIGGKRWRISPAGRWVCRKGDTWMPGDIHLAVAKEEREETPSATSPLPSTSHQAAMPSSSEAASTASPIPVLALVAAGTVLLLLIIGGITFWATSLEGKPPPPAVAVAVSPTATQTILPTLTPIPPTSTPSHTLAPPTPTATVSPSTTPTPPPPPVPTETLSPTIRPTPISSTETPIPPLQGKIGYADYDMANETYHIYLLDLSNPTPVKLIENAAEPSFSPDGKQIAYRSYAPDRRGLWVQNLDGSGRWQLSYGHESARPQWSPDGRGLIYASRQAGDRQWRLYYPIDEVIEIPGQGWAADWLSADKLIFAGAVEGQPQPGFYLANMDGSGATSFILDRTGTAPAVSFDGRYLAYTSQGNDSNNWDVYVANADGTSIRRLTSHLARDGIPTWSPDGTYVAFASDRDGGWGIWVIDAGSRGQPRRLVPLTYGLDLHPRDATPDERHDWTLHTLTWSR
jgi:hypothetical protein